MTSKCKQLPKHQAGRWSLCAFSIGAVLFLINAIPLSASGEEGAKIPPPPALKTQNRDDNTPDPEFKSPLKGSLNQSLEQPQDLRDQMRQQRRQQFKHRLQKEAGQFPPAGFSQAQTGPDGEFGPPPGGPPGDFAPPSGRFGPPGGGFGPPGSGFGPQGEMAPQGPEPEGGFGRGRFGNRNGFGGEGMHRHGGHMHGEGFMGANRLDLTPLNLTDEQKQRIKDMRQATREKAKVIREQMLRKQLAFRNILFSAEATEPQIRQARKDLRKLQDQMDELNLEDMLKIRSVLTAQQKQKLPSIAPGRPPGAGLAGSEDDRQGMARRAVGRPGFDGPPVPPSETYPHNQPPTK